ncbi:MAG: peptide ABC transporter permease [Candidatus Raymondbacteria bacterium RifOxyA12_full_50_37]|uniref:Peptide ABC transporter permease n=1 Tax=Candidatus Raymondbacteria bacterium RIFOXYD12_FULL_49_13 TaxID=1817890 RepID=A0A1F7FKA7_UNCRA|nr:MAG: peptide ABC transporter permease [Candidatus Raymondbacteria bacterium RifOxyA12_full_50_37]OGJ94572.1 MAG: peptide ABC transporter permease [Candidatus Raymondbacteria bacterium RIFOXYA2_FULL_49_16]OGK00538.1 MAG: peptide ABC transporter permease [Candidatus Raymondbacteria bacterium RifOxyB12_full_50_8]OGK07048.1 MAG: peptide ABC transporter permease [Candidatus Raymondbacteria bacterium RIFOXYD12_FULL_49_13]OGP45521.1 MAG: peptide ABC transporter permease [Candidatus Raymondbacteria 
MKREEAKTQDLGYLSQWQLIRIRFIRHRLAVAALFLLITLYTMALFAEFFAPYPSLWKNLHHTYSPPQPVRFSLEHGLYVFGMRQHIDPITFKHDYIENTGDIIPLRLFVKGEHYKLWGLIPLERHFFGPDRDTYKPKTVRGGFRGDISSSPVFYLLGADKYGQDILSRIIYGARISLSIGFVSILVTFFLGIVIGGISGYVGGAVDNIIQRSIEIINAFPQLPLWLALGAALPSDWPPLRIYFAITIVLSLLGWTGLARVVRGKLLSLREEDYAVAARLLGASHRRVIFRHLLPGFTSHIIVELTLRVPIMILGETSLSFLGLGLRPPVVSWGVMLQDCMNMQAVANYPWLLLPVVFIILAVLCFNFLGDGLRDAADPYSAR